MNLIVNIILLNKWNDKKKENFLYHTPEELNVLNESNPLKEDNTLEETNNEILLERKNSWKKILKTKFKNNNFKPNKNKKTVNKVLTVFYNKKSYLLTKKKYFWEKYKRIIHNIIQIKKLSIKEYIIKELIRLKINEKYLLFFVYHYYHILRRYLISFISKPKTLPLFGSMPLLIESNKYLIQNSTYNYYHALNSIFIDQFMYNYFYIQEIKSIKIKFNFKKKILSITIKFYNYYFYLFVNNFINKYFKDHKINNKKKQGFSKTINKKKLSIYLYFKH